MDTQASGAGTGSHRPRGSPGYGRRIALGLAQAGRTLVAGENTPSKRQMRVKS